MQSDKELMQMALDAMRAVSVDEHLCNAAHHIKKDRHGIDEPCPIAKRFNDIAEALRARLAQPEQEIDPDRPHVEDDGCPTEKAVLQRFWREHQAQPERKLWLWKNFVDGRPEYWAFDNPYPTNLDNGDPQTLGQPCGYAIFKPSRDGSRGRTEEQVLREMESVSARSEREWQWLTDAEVIKLGRLDKDSDYFGLWYDFGRAVEAKLKEKNT